MDQCERSDAYCILFRPYHTLTNKQTCGSTRACGRPGPRGARRRRRRSNRWQPQLRRAATLWTMKRRLSTGSSGMRAWWRWWVELNGCSPGMLTLMLNWTGRSINRSISLLGCTTHTEPGAGRSGRRPGHGAGGGGRGGKQCPCTRGGDGGGRGQGAGGAWGGGGPAAGGRGEGEGEGRGDDEAAQDRGALNGPGGQMIKRQNELWGR